MNKTFRAAALACALASARPDGRDGRAHAQSAERVYDQGTVWRVTAVEVKPGMFDTYMESTCRRLAGRIQEDGKKHGDIVSYRILTVDLLRDHEPDLYLMVEYKNMAVFDRSLKDADAETAAVFGSVAKALGNGCRQPRGHAQQSRPDPAAGAEEFMNWEGGAARAVRILTLLPWGFAAAAMGGRQPTAGEAEKGGARERSEWEDEGVRTYPDISEPSLTPHLPAAARPGPSLALRARCSVRSLRRLCRCRRPHPAKLARRNSG